MVTAVLDNAFLPLVARLNQASVTKRYEAFRDVDWDAPDGRIDRRDPRFALSATDTLGGTEWYQSLPPDRRAELGIDWACQILAVGISFESCLTRGLLEFAGTLPHDSVVFRYAMHEVIEESHHSMMFHEFIRRSGCSPDGVSSIETWFQCRVAHLGVTFPELFMLCVLSGEVFVDYDNRQRLRQPEPLHPTLQRIMQIHVTEEARHVSFARGYLRERLPGLSRFRRFVLHRLSPVLFGRGEALMLRPPASLVRRYGIPAPVIAEAYGPKSEHAKKVREVVAPIYALLADKHGPKGQLGDGEHAITRPER